MRQRGIRYETTNEIDMVEARPWARLAAQRLSSAQNVYILLVNPLTRN